MRAISNNQNKNSAKPRIWKKTANDRTDPTDLGRVLAPIGRVASLPTRRHCA